MLKAGQNFDFAGNQALNFIFHVLSGAPSAPKEGQSYYNSLLKGTFTWNGSAWRPHDAAMLTDGSLQWAALPADPRQRSTHTGTQTAATISDFASAVKAITLDAMAAPAGDVGFNSKKATGLAPGVNPTDAINLSQAQTLISQAIAGQTAVKKPATYIVTGNVTQSGVSSITNTTSDGTESFTPSVNDRLLCVGMADNTKNGLFTAQTGAWVRAVDADEPTEWTEGTDILIARGTLYGGTIWRLTSQGTVTPGSSAMTFTQVAKVNVYTADNVSLQLVGMQFSVKLSPGGGVTYDANGLKADFSVVAGKKTIAFTGDGTTQSFVLTHNLGTTDVVVYVRDATGNTWLCDCPAKDANNVYVNFSANSIPQNGLGFRATIIG